jgi:hypothetical protein
MWTKELTLTVQLIPFTNHLSSHHSRTLADKSSTGASGGSDVNSGQHFYRYVVVVVASF